MALTTQQIATRDEWLDAVRRLVPDYPITEFGDHWLSPNFRIGPWKIGIEHLRDFESVVLGWHGDREQWPVPQDGWVVTCRSDQEKRWHFRVKLKPAGLRRLLDQMRPSDTVAAQIAEFERRVTDALRDTEAKRLSRLASVPEAEKTPACRDATTTVYVRNPDVVAQRLFLANGICEDCRQPAPFNRRGTDLPYLEVHHVIRLADGGRDTVENARALCPNCHRKRHYG